MVGDAVEQGAGEALAGEDGGPFLEGQVRGDDCGAVFVAPAEDVEQQLASGLRQGHVSEFVDDQEADLASWAWRRSSLFSSRASISSWTNWEAVAKRTPRPFWQAAC